MKHGVAFGDFIKTEKHRRIRSNGGYEISSPVRDYMLLVVLGITIAVIVVRIFFIQIVNGAYYKGLSDSNRIRTITIHAPRGIILDRNNQPLVYNIPGFRYTEKDKTKLLNRETAINLMAKGVTGIEVDVHRQYPYKEAFAHVLGYIGQISEEELKSPQHKNYKGGDLIGKIGIEKMYQKELIGIDGKTLNEVDNTGEKIRLLGQTDPIPGKNLTLTLDADLQVAAYNALPKDKKGVVIVSNPEGEILTMVSKPSFDPNLFTLDETYKTATDSSYTTVESVVLDGVNQPMLNRAVGGVYPPGSTFKLITAAAALENNIVDEKYEVEDTGVLRVGEFSFGNWYFLQYGGKDGMVDVEKAIARSNDIYFYVVAEKIGVEKLSEMARKFGLGAKSGVDIQGELTGIVPDPKWKKEAIGEPWYLGDTYHYGIGQGYALTTPLQVNMMTNVVANNGVLVKPHLIKGQKPEARSQKFLSSSTIDPIRRGMIESCSPAGVAWPLFEFKVKNEKLKIDGKNFLEAPQSTQSAEFKDYRKVTVACKTGTAQHGGETTLPHSWITLFAPAEDPQIIVTVLVDSGGEGSSIAGPVAKKVLEEWFTR